MRRLVLTRRLLWLLILIVAIVLLDQWIKRLMVDWIGPGAYLHRHELLGSFVAFEYLENRGAAFGMFQNSTALLAVLSIMIVAVALVALVRIAVTDYPVAIGISLIVGGALGNAVDRFGRGYVVDYFAICRFWKFNLADAAVTIGALITFWMLWRADSVRQSTIIKQEHP
jgi:signal peptidase II